MNWLSRIGQALTQNTRPAEPMQRAGTPVSLPRATGSTNVVRPRSPTFSSTAMPQPPRPLPAPTKEGGLVVGRQTTLTDIVRDFSNADGKHLRMSRQEGGIPELHTHQAGTINNPFTTIGQHRAAYDLVLDVLTRELGGDETAARRILDENGCSRNRGVPCDRLRDIQIGCIHAARAEAAKPASVAARVEAANQFLRTGQGQGMNALVPAGATAKMSETGMGGALKVKDAQGRLVAVIKPDDRMNHDRAQFVEAMAVPLRSAGAMMGFPASDRLTLSAEQKQGLKEIIGAPPPGQTDRATPAKTNIDLNGQVTRMQPAKGTDLSSLPWDQRISLIKSGQFGRDVGYGAVMCMMAGLSDHLSLNGTGGGKNLVNMDNFILGEDGMIHAIDPGVEIREGVFGATKDEITSTIGKIKALLERAGNAGSLEEFADQLIARTEADPDSSVIGAIVGDILFTPGKQGFFKNQHEIAQLGQEDKRNLVIGMLQGLITGLEFAQAHGTAIGAGYEGAARAGLPHHFGDSPKAFFTDLGGQFQTGIRDALAHKAGFEARLGEAA